MRFGLALRRRRRSALGRVHFQLAAADRAPFLVFGNGHAALDADADSRLWWVVLAKNLLEE